MFSKISAVSGLVRATIFLSSFQPHDRQLLCQYRCVYVRVCMPVFEPKFEFTVMDGQIYFPHGFQKG